MQWRPVRSSVVCSGTMFKYFFLIAVVGGVCALVYLGKHGFFPKTKPAVVSAAVAPLNGNQHFNGELLRDELRASASGYLQTEKYGVFKPGRMHELGKVLFVDRDRAVIEVRPGVRIRVEAYEGINHAPASPSPTAAAVVSAK